MFFEQFCTFVLQKTKIAKTQKFNKFVKKLQRHLVGLEVPRYVPV